MLEKSPARSAAVGTRAWLMLAVVKSQRSKPAKKKVLSLKMGPPTVAPNCL